MASETQQHPQALWAPQESPGWDVSQTQDPIIPHERGERPPCHTELSVTTCLICWRTVAVVVGKLQARVSQMWGSVGLWPMRLWARGPTLKLGGPPTPRSLT